MSDNDCSPIAQIDVLAEIFKNSLKEFAIDFVAMAYLHEIPFEKALDDYLISVKIMPNYGEWASYLEEIIRDCVADFGMERWWVESCLNLNLDEEIEKGYRAAWKEIMTK